MFGFIKQLFGGKTTASANQDSVKHEVKPQAVASSLPAGEVRSAPAAVLQRDELIDAKTRIAGYRFSARCPESPAQADPAATVEILRASNIAQFAERRLALVPLQAGDWHSFAYGALVGPNTTFLLVHPKEECELAAWQEVAAQIKQTGGCVAVREAVGLDEGFVRQHADYLLIDYSSYALPRFEQMVRKFRVSLPNVKLIVEHVPTWAEQRYCISLGVALCMGSFVTEPDENQQAGEIGQSRLILIEMLNLLRQDADLAELAKIAKQDPGVVVKLVNMANSPMLGLRQGVTGIDQAMMLLGREQLYRWLSIGMFRAGAGAPRDEVLLEVSLARGRFLELIGQERHGKSECDELFLLGLLSLLDSLLGVRMDKLLERIHLSEAIRQVLLNNSGPLSRYLMLAIAVEKGHPENVQRLADQLEIPLGDIEAAAISALAWAEEAVSFAE